MTDKGHKISRIMGFPPKCAEVECKMLEEVRPAEVVPSFLFSTAQILWGLTAILDQHLHAHENGKQFTGVSVGVCSAQRFVQPVSSDQRFHSRHDAEIRVRLHLFAGLEMEKSRFLFGWDSAVTFMATFQREKGLTWLVTQTEMPFATF